MMIAQYRAFRSIPFFAESTLLYMIECKTGFEHQWYKEHAEVTEKLPNVFTLQEHEDQIGFNTTHPIKLQRAYALKRCFEADRLELCEEIITVNPDPKRNAKAVTETLISQIENLREFQKVTMKDTSVYVTALFNSDFKRIPNRKDDAVQALQVILKSAPDFLAEALAPSQFRQIRFLRNNINPQGNPHTLRIGHV